MRCLFHSQKSAHGTRHSLKQSEEHTPVNTIYQCQPEEQLYFIQPKINRQASLMPDDRQNYRLYSAHQVRTDTKLYMGICASLGMHHIGVIRKQNFRETFWRCAWEQREIKNINLE